MSVQQVIEQIQQMNMLHLELLQLGKTKRTVLIQNEVDKLAEIVQQESQLVRSISEVEKGWRDAAKAVFAEKGLMPESEPTVSDLLPLIDNEKDQHELEQARNELMATMEELKQVHTLNQQLIEQSLAMIEYTIELIAGAPEEITYQHPNDHRSPERRSVFDRRT
jgi:vacuolar-type H+-ATPase subunit I/STV1